MTPPTPAATLVESLARQLGAGGGLTFHFDHQPYTVRELVDDATRLGAWLDAHVPAGARVGLMARNGRPALLLWWACTFTGRVLVPFNTGVRGAVLDHQLSDSDLSLVVLDAAAIEFGDLSVRKPTLDDVFLTLTGRPAEEESPAAGPAVGAGDLAGRGSRA